MTTESRNSSAKERLPLLVGMLVDVSASMAERIGNSGGQGQTRLEAFADSLDNYVARTRTYCTEVGENPETLMHLFAYGFGFGNLLTKLRGIPVSPVQSLLPVREDSPVITGAELLSQWSAIKKHVVDMRSQMLGATPMVEAFRTAERVLESVRRVHRYRESPVLLVISDGLPTDPPDGGPDLVLASADRLRDAGAISVSSFVTGTDLTLPRRLYTSPEPGWPPGARLMFECASPASDCPAVIPYLEEYGWEVPVGARLFSQINRSDFLSEFVGAALPSNQQPLPPRPPGEQSAVRVFVSYSHQDSGHIAERDSLLSYLRGLEREGVSFWCDTRIDAGDLWDAELRRQMARADIALFLVSQAFLNSKYCRDVEAVTFTKARRSKGLRVVPVILSACDWQTVGWLSELQVIPGEGRNIEQHFERRGARLALYLEILQQLRGHCQAIQSQRPGTAGKEEL